MSEMIERVAKALCVADGKVGPEPGWPNWMGETWRNSYREHARAAIQAMREPTEAMIVAWVAASPRSVRPFARPDAPLLQDDKDEAVAAWQLLIDAALSDKST